MKKRAKKAGKGPPDDTEARRRSLADAARRRALMSKQATGYRSTILTGPGGAQSAVLGG